MRAIHSLTQGGAWILTTLVVASACHSGPRSEALTRHIDEVSLIAERDSLLAEVTANAKLISDIQSELGRVEAKPARAAPESASLEVTKDQRAYTLERVRQLTTRLQAAESHLVASERRAQRLARTVDSLGEQNGEAKSTINDLMAMIVNQRETMTTLGARVDSLTTVALDLADSVGHLTDDHNTAYFVVGTRDELLAKGVVTEEGPRSFPLIGRRKVVPARQLPLGEFTSIDRSVTRRIPLPDSTKHYTIVSRQDLSQLESPVHGTEVSDSIQIGAPDSFWEPSRYLIVMER
ncbi:MAG TPA: hypothetical protein VMG41_05955 [Gemmatimonadales bacterium]|nr:hypothetical protein [Gemmatimonadales bacterium]